MDEARLRLIVREEIRKGRVVDPDPLGPDNIRLRWRDWVPAYTNLTVGNGTVVARYVRVGRTVHLYYHLVFGSTTSIDGTAPTLTFPVTPSTSYLLDTNVIGQAVFLDDGTTQFFGLCRIKTATTLEARVFDAAATNTRATSLTATVPMTWTTSDALAISATYEAAA